MKCNNKRNTKSIQSSKKTLCKKTNKCSQTQVGNKKTLILGDNRRETLQKQQHVTTPWRIITSPKNKDKKNKTNKNNSENKTQTNKQTEKDILRNGK